MASLQVQVQVQALGPKQAIVVDPDRRLEGNREPPFTALV